MSRTTCPIENERATFRNEPIERRARPKAELDAAFRSEPVERRARPKAELE